MSHQLKLRFASAAEAVPFLEKVPEFDKDILGYPSLRIVCSYNSSPVAYLPMQKALMLETLAFTTAVDDLKRAEAMRDSVKGAEVVASSDGIREIYFLGTDEKMVRIAKHHGFEELPWPVMRLKL